MTEDCQFAHHCGCDLMSHAVVVLLIIEICQQFGKISEDRRGEGVPSGPQDCQALSMSLLAPSVSVGPEDLKRTEPNSSLSYF